MAFAYRTMRRHRGMTLVEIMMVITIMVILLAVSIPMMRPAFKDRGLREATRQVNAFCVGAQARAAETGRPVGVWMTRVDATPEGSRRCVQLFLCEVGPSFSGATIGSKVTVGAIVPGIPPRRQLIFPALDAAILRTMIDPGEYFTIKFDHKGLDYAAGRLPAPAAPPNDFIVEIPPADTPMPPLSPLLTTGLEYDIKRGPIRSNASPLRLPSDTAIDLSVSGFGSAGNQFDRGLLPTSPVLIMFMPTGRVGMMFVDGRAVFPLGPINLMIGRVSKVVDPTITNFVNQETAAEANLTETSNFWVTIGHRTGTVVTTDNVDTSFLPAAATLSDRLRAARDLARTKIQKGGR